MTKAEKMAEEVLTKIYNIVEGVDSKYDERELAILQDAFHQVATEKTISILKKTAWGMEEGGPGTEFVFCSDIIKDRWEDEEVKLPGFKDIIGLYKDKDA